MKQGLDRRSLILGAGIGAASGILGSCARGTRLPAIADDHPPRPADLEELARAFRSVSRLEAPDLAARAIAAGTDRATFLGAVFLAGLEDIRPRPVGNALHCVMMIESAFLLTDDAPADEAWIAALWALDDFKNSQERDPGGGDGELAPPGEPEGRQRSPDEARGELSAALEGFDPDRADRAAVALLSCTDPDEVFEVLRPYATRSFHDAGHRIIHFAQAERTLRRVGPRCALPALRSIVIGLAGDSPGAHTEDFHRARGLAGRLPQAWLAGAEEPQRSLEVLRALRGRTPAESQDAVVEAFRSGLGPATVWDGLRLYASELMLHRLPKERHFPVHTVTEIEAFGHAWERARDEAARRLIVLQAGAWISRLRDAVARNDGPFRNERGIGALGLEAGSGGEDARADLSAALAARSPDGVCAALDREPGLARECIARLRTGLVRRASQNHQYKYAGSILVESRRVAEPWRGRVLAAGVDYLPGADARASGTCERSVRALRQQGVL